MRIRLWMLTVLLATVVGWTGAFAQTDADVLIQTLLETPPAQRDALYEQHRSALGTAFVYRLIQSALERATQGKLDDANARAALADDIDCFLLGRREYRGIGLYALGSFLIGQGRANEALPMADEILRHSATCFRGHFLRGRAFIALRQYDRAQPEAAAVVQEDANNEDAHIMMAQIDLARDDRAGALAEFQTILKINPQNPLARDAIAMLTAPETAPQNQLDADAISHFNQAERYFKQGKYHDAIAEYQRTVELAPRFSNAYVNIAYCYEKLRDRGKAVEYYRKAIEIDPRDRQAYRFLGVTYESVYDQGKDVSALDKAIECYRQALQIDPHYSLAAADLERARQKRTHAVPPK